MKSWIGFGEDNKTPLMMKAAMTQILTCTDHMPSVAPAAELGRFTPRSFSVAIELFEGSGTFHFDSAGTEIVSSTV